MMSLVVSVTEQKNGGAFALTHLQALGDNNFYLVKGGTRAEGR